MSRIISSCDLEPSRAILSHVLQAEAVAWLLKGGHLMLCTPTASGKSLAYHLPVLHAAATDPAARAIYIFPTKVQKRATSSLPRVGLGMCQMARKRMWDQSSLQVYARYWLS